MRALSLRQRQVLTRAAYGQTNMQIARTLEISSKTVNRHLTETYDALGARDRANAVALAIHGGDISLGELTRIADAATQRGAKTLREAPGGPQAAEDGSGGTREGRTASNAPDEHAEAAA